MLFKMPTPAEMINWPRHHLTAFAKKNGCQCGVLQPSEPAKRPFEVYDGIGPWAAVIVQANQSITIYNTLLARCGGTNETLQE